VACFFDDLFFKNKRNVGGGGGVGFAIHHASPSSNTQVLKNPVR